MWMPPTHPRQSLHTHTQMHFQSLDHSQTGVEDSNTLISGYESFTQSSSQLGSYGGIFEPMHMVENANHIIPAGDFIDEVNVGETRINRMNETIVEEREEVQEAQTLEDDDVQPWRQVIDARNSKSSQLSSRAHSRSPAPRSNFADDSQEARRTPPEALLASPPSSFPPSGLVAPTALKSTALSGNPHNNQHRSVGQYKGLSSQAKRKLKSSISLDSLRSSHPFSQNSHYSLPLRLSSSTITTSVPAPSDSISATASTSIIRDQVASPNPSTRSSGIDKKVFQSRLRRRPSAQLSSSANILDSLKLEDTMMAHSPQHIQPHEKIIEMAELSSTEHLLDKNRADSSFGALLPLSPPPSATRPEFMGTGLASNTFHMPGEAGLSFNASELSLIKPHSMSALGDISPFHETGPGESGIPQMSEQYQDINQVGESSLFIRRSPPDCWASSNWLAEIPHPQSLEMGIMESPPGQSPTTQQWIEHEDTEAANLRLSATNGIPMMMPGINHSQTTFRLASPPTGRGIHRMPSCPSFSGSSLGYQIQQPPSPAVEEHEEANYSGYMERSGSNSSSLIPSPPDSPDFYLPTSQLTAPNLGYVVTPLITQDGFGSDMYTQMPEPQHNGVHQSSIASTPRSSRTPSRSIPSAAAAAAAAALAATKNSSKASKNRNTRRVVSNSNGRSSSSRNGSASSSSGSVSGGRGLGLGSEGGEMPFVNFTPQDATKILSGVAPSGSSKTKARREKEALEKRRKLSEAAVAVVLAAGGDVSQLNEELLTIN